MSDDHLRIWPQTPLHHSIRVTPADSIWFPILKSNSKISPNSITNPAAFDISIQIYAVELPGVTIRQPNYQADSLQNRKNMKKYLITGSRGCVFQHFRPQLVALGLTLMKCKLLSVPTPKKNSCRNG